MYRNSRTPTVNPAGPLGETKRPGNVLVAGWEPHGDNGPARGRLRATQPARRIIVSKRKNRNWSACCLRFRASLWRWSRDIALAQLWNCCRASTLHLWVVRIFREEAIRAGKIRRLAAPRSTLLIAPSRVPGDVRPTSGLSCKFRAAITSAASCL